MVSCTKLRVFSGIAAITGRGIFVEISLVEDCSRRSVGSHCHGLLFAANVQNKVGSDRLACSNRDSAARKATKTPSRHFKAVRARLQIDENVVARASGDCVLLNSC